MNFLCYANEIKEEIFLIERSQLLFVILLQWNVRRTSTELANAFYELADDG